MQTMAQLLRRNGAPSDLVKLTAAEDAKNGPYHACSCGSGKKFRFCHGERAPESSFSGLPSDLNNREETKAVNPHQLINDPA